MTTFRNRRGFLQLAGATGAASIAGCASLGIGDDADDTDESDSGDEPDPEGEEEIDIPDSALTAAVEPDQEALQELEGELTQQMEEGDISEEEAQQEFQERQLELAEEATVELESTAEGSDDLTVIDSISEAGVVLLDGDAEAMVAALNDGEMNALLSGETFAMVQQQQQMQAQLEDEMQAEAEAEAEADAEGDEEDDTEGDEDAEE